MLLFWSRDVAHGRRLAAVKFDNLVKIDTIRIVPAGIAPFAAVPEENGFVACCGVSWTAAHSLVL